MRKEFLKSLQACNNAEREEAACFCNAMTSVIYDQPDTLGPSFWTHPSSKRVAQLIHDAINTAGQYEPEDDEAMNWLEAEAMIRDYWKLPYV